MLTQRYNSGGLIGGTLLIGLGLLFLVARLFNVEAWGYLWPFIVIGIGALFFAGMLGGGKSAAPLAIPGSIIGLIGLMLLVQNLTGYWSSWSYGWTVIFFAVGVGLWISGEWGDSPRQRRVGLRLMESGVILFVIFGAFFELILGDLSGSLVRQAFFPVLLILIGLYLVVRRTVFWPGRSGPSDPAAGTQPPSPLGTPRA